MNRIANYLFLLLVITFVASCSPNDENEGGDGQTYLYQITVKEHEKKFGEFSSWGEIYEQYTYNEKGLLEHEWINHLIRADLGRRNDHTYYTYDERGRLLTKRETTYSVDNYIYKYTHNAIDSIATMDQYNRDGDLLESWAYTYDSQNRLLQAKQTYDPIIAYVYDYSYNGNNTTVVRHRIDTGELFGTHLYEYDNYKNLIRSTWTNGETGKESIEELNEYVYDSSGKMIKKTSHDYYFKSDLTYYTYTYNTDGTIDKIHLSYSYKNDESELRYEYTYK